MKNLIFKDSKKKKSAFTLAEVLITLGVIGVVAALTLPNLMSTYKAHTLKTQFMKANSTLQQVFRLMQADDESLDPSDYPRNSDGHLQDFYKIFFNYLSGATDCKSFTTSAKKGCFNANKNEERTKEYKTLDGKKDVHYSFFDDGQILLSNGTLLLFEHPDSGEGGASHIWIFADINGANNPPNRLGYDLFAFQFLEGGIRPMGAAGTEYSNIDVYCDINGTNGWNGMTCTAKAISDPDYFKRITKSIK